MNNATQCAVVAAICGIIAIILRLVGIAESVFIPWSWGVGIGAIIWLLIAFVYLIKK